MGLKMAESVIDIIIFAPLAPIFGMILFWFLQLLFIESQKYLLSKIRKNHEALCRFTNFLGIFFQTISHALGYTVTKSGIAQFYISVNYGKVAPKREKKGVYEWLSNGFLFVGPFFIPPFLLLICLFFLMSSGFNLASQQYYTFSESLIIFGANLYTFSLGFFGFLAAIDLLHPAHVGFCILLIFLGLGIRPSYIGENKQEKVDMFYDLKNIRYNLLHKPVYVLFFFLSSYILFYVSFLLHGNWYVSLFSIFGWLSIIAMVAIFIAHLILFLIKATDELPSFWKIVPYLGMIGSYGIMRTVFLYFPSSLSLSVSLFTMILVTGVITLSLQRFKTNKFKSFPGMISSQLVEDGSDEPRRIIR